jgi:hypothetical protein
MSGWLKKKREREREGLPRGTRVDEFLQKVKSENRTQTRSLVEFIELKLNSFSSKAI